MAGISKACQASEEADNKALNPAPVQPLARAAAVPSLARNARSARVNAKPFSAQPNMKRHFILEQQSARRRDEFLEAVVRSRKLHGHWASPPRTAQAFRESLKRFRSKAHIGYWVCTEGGELAGAININEIVRGRFCSAYLGYYALVPHNGVAL